MESTLLHAIPTAVDVLALFICLGTLSCRLWVLPNTPMPPGTTATAALLTALWRLLLVGIAALVISSLGELVERAVGMSGSPLSAVLPVLPIVLWRTHYGRLWLIRPVALTALWILWWVGNRHLQSRVVPTVMLGVGAIVAMTRSASGHAADWGDLTRPELSDWLHLLAASCWGGGLLALALVVLPAVVKLPEQRRHLIATIAGRFSTLAGVAFTSVLLTGFYNAWLQVGSVAALWATSYGRTLLTKLLLVMLLLILGASNRYLSVPLLQRWAGLQVPRRRLLHTLLVLRYLATGRRKRRRIWLVRQFTRNVWAEVICVIGVVLCTALLLHSVPARHALEMGHMHAETRSPPDASAEVRPPQ